MTAVRQTGPALHGAYGYRFSGIDGLNWMIEDDIADWPELQLSYEEAEFVREPAELLADTAEISMPPVKAKIVLDRIGGTVRFRGPIEPLTDEIVHPCLWPAAAVFARWQGRETFHAGAFLDDDGGAWAVLGDSGDGKSTLMAALALAGRPILVDDLLVTEANHCFAGPRCLDLRPESADALGIIEQTAVVRGTHRRRMTLSSVPAHAPLRGWVHLDWGEEISVRPLVAAELIERLARHRRVLPLGVDPVDLLDLGARPTLLLSRPQNWDALSEACQALLATVNSGRFRASL